MMRVEGLGLGLAGLVLSGTALNRIDKAALPTGP